MFSVLNKDLPQDFDSIQKYRTVTFACPRGYVCWNGCLLDLEADFEVSATCNYQNEARTHDFRLRLPLASCEKYIDLVYLEIDLIYDSHCDEPMIISLWTPGVNTKSGIQVSFTHFISFSCVPAIECVCARVCACVCVCACEVMIELITRGSGWNNV